MIGTNLRGAYTTIWGNRYKDWANIQEETSKDGYTFVLNSLLINTSTNLLDVGCGTGFFSKLASEREANVTGIDATAVFIEQAKIRLPNASFLIADMEALPFKDGSFDIVCGFNSFQYAVNIKNALTDAKRVLTPQGKLAIMIWGKKEDCECATLLKAISTLLPSVPDGNTGPFSLSENQLLELTLSEIGFRNLKVTDIPSTWTYPSKEIALKGLLSLGAVSKAIEINSIDKVQQVILDAIKPYTQSNRQVIYHNKYRIIIAEN